MFLYFYILSTPHPPRNNCEIFIANRVRPLGQQNVTHNSQPPEEDMDSPDIMIIPGNKNAFQ